jgi:TetR/AcrR family transcriptional regulator, fatty acid metabolism regulator protein
MIEDITDRQQEIMEAACKLLTAGGASGLTIKNLAKEMQFSESAIYRHFASKEEIIISLLQYLATSMDVRLTNAVSELQSPKEKFEAIFKNQFSFFSENPCYVVAVFSDGLMEESQRINEVILKIMGVKMKHVMAIIVEGQEKGIFTDEISAEEMIHLVIGTFRLQMFKWRVANFQFDIKSVGERMIQSLLILLLKK